MKQTLQLLMGLPGSGKSYYARELVKDPNWKRVNKDDLRSMVDNSIHTDKREKLICKIEEEIVRMCLKDGYSVVVDNTHFNKVHKDRYYQLVKKEFPTVNFEVQFFDTPLQTCIERDSKREKPVGKAVIMRMYNQYLRHKGAPILRERIDGLPRAIICDIDGTIAHFTNRSPFDWKRVGEDEVNTTIRSILYGCEERLQTIILMSGRDEVCRKETEQWLKDNKVPYDHLFMRPEGNNEPDEIIKWELFKKYVDGKYNVDYILDDRNKVVAMWRSHNLVVLQCNDGDF